MNREQPNIPSDVRDSLEADASTDPDVPADSGIWDTVWTLLGRAAPSDEALPDAEETWSAVEQHLDETREDRRERASRPPRQTSRRWTTQWRLWRWGTLGAAALVLLLAIWWWTLPVDVVAPAGTTVSHTLPDGSTVELHGDTRLTYGRSFRTISLLEADRRTVHLEGEAYFDVTSGDRPFVVKTEALRVDVLGTSFAVRSRTGEAQEAHVALIEGRLRVTDQERPDTQRTLAPGQVTTRLRPGTLSPPRDTSIRRITAWRRGGFAVTKRSLPALARDLERRFGQTVRLHPSIGEAARSDPLTLYYPRAASLEPILHDVCMARGLTYRATATGYVLANGRNSTPPEPK